MAKKNSNLHSAKAAKNDEFYTRLEDIENEVRYYKEHFKGKILLCPCDESEHTNFYKHFMLNIEEYGWKKLICVGYRENRAAEVHIVTVDENGNEIEENVTLMGNGDFRNEETQKFFDECDVVVTNPPFSLFREFVDLIMNKGKKFLIIGNKNALTFKEFFPLVRDNKVWLGYTSPSKFYQLSCDEVKNMTGLTRWFTNLPIPKREVVLDTGIDFEYGLKKGWYKKYDNYDVINVDKTNQIPMDYDGIMGVPITYIDKHNPNQFEILGIANSARYIGHECLTIINGKKIYNRILIRKKQ